MNIFFDMDYTLLGADDTLRPGAREVMQRLKDDGHVLYVWSGNGIRWAEVRQHGLEPLVADCFTKPLSNHAEAMKRLPVKPDLVIDDYPEVPTALGGIWVRPYVYSNSNSNDDEMERVYRVITEYARNGHSEDGQFRSKPRG